MADDNDDLQVEAAGHDPARPEWLPEKYADEAAFAKAHTELDQAYGRQGQELGELRGQLEQMQAQLEQMPPQQQYYSDPNENPLVTAYARAFEEGDVQGMLAVTAQIAQATAQAAAPAPPQQDYSLVAQFAENQVRAAHPDYDTYRDEAMSVLQSNPQLVPEGSSLTQVQNGITAALEVARGRALHQQSQAEAQKQQQAEAQRLAKINSQTVPGGGTRPQAVDQKSDLWERIKNADTGGFRLPT